MIQTEVYPPLKDMLPRKKKEIRWKDAWNIFRGPKVGSQAPNDHLVARSNEPQTTLYDVMDDVFSDPNKKYVVVLFGWSECGDVCPNMKLVADRLVATYPEVAAYAVTPYYDDLRYDPINNILGDPDLSAEKKYGATGTAIYVIDRSKLIVWKSSGLQEKKLNLFLNSKLDSL